MKLIISNATELTLFELDAVRNAFKESVKNKLPRGGKKLYKAGIDLPHCCDVLVRRYDKTGDYAAEVKK